MNLKPLLITFAVIVGFGTSAIVFSSAGAEAPTEKVSAPVASSGDQVIQINVAAPFTPKQGVGLIVSSTGVIQRQALTIQKAKEGIYTVTFSCSKNELRKDSFASASLVSEKGETAFGDVKSLSNGLPKSSFLSIPQCASGGAQVSVDRNKFGALETLVHYRTERRDTYKKELDSALSGPFLEKLKKLELGFGLDRGTPLSGNLPPEELLDRLSRLRGTILNLSEQNKN